MMGHGSIVHCFGKGSGNYMSDQHTDEVQTLDNGQDLMVEVDGVMIPNYDATILTFEEGDIVTGTVVRVDKDEVLVDIGYKSEGVVPANELSKESRSIPLKKCRWATSSTHSC
jgi:DNA-directed RNA polymerase subunit E'/Rpb7